MVFVGNIENVEVLVKTSHLLAPFPEPMIDAASLIVSAYIPGWEIPKMRPEFLTTMVDCRLSGGMAARDAQTHLWRCDQQIFHAGPGPESARYHCMSVTPCLAS